MYERLVMFATRASVSVSHTDTRVLDSVLARFAGPCSSGIGIFVNLGDLSLYMGNLPGGCISLRGYAACKQALWSSPKAAAAQPRYHGSTRNTPCDCPSLSCAEPGVRRL
jgi:hypothetical protein